MIKWLWKTLEELNREERVLFLKFVSGRSRLPAVAADIPQRFQVMKVDKVSPDGYIKVVLQINQLLKLMKLLKGPCYYTELG